MSWAVSLDTTLGYRILRAIDALELADAARSPEAEAQLAAAQKAAKDLIAADVLGPAPAFQVSLTGHCNPAREPRTGQSNDSVSVTVTAVYQEPSP